MSAPLQISSARRWLFMVMFGCVVLDATRPALAAGPAMETRPGGTLYSGDPAAPPPPGNDAGGGAWRWLLVSAMFAAGAGWFYWKRRHGGFAMTRMERKIIVEETRSLGNRQYLVVASYEQRKFLLGVTPGQIQFLARLDGEGGGRKGDSWRRSFPK